jgi:hypothetical protein
LTKRKEKKGGFIMKNLFKMQYLEKVSLHIHLESSLVPRRGGKGQLNCTDGVQVLEK